MYYVVGYCVRGSGIGTVLLIRLMSSSSHDEWFQLWGWPDKDEAQLELQLSSAQLVFHLLLSNSLSTEAAVVAVLVQYF